jgi:hypothetical protein
MDRAQRLELGHARSARPRTGAPQRRYEIAPGTDGRGFGNAGRLWAVSEPGLGIFMTIPSSVCSNRFSRWSSRSTYLAWSESDDNAYRGSDRTRADPSAPPPISPAATS